MAQPRTPRPPRMKLQPVIGDLNPDEKKVLSEWYFMEPPKQLRKIAEELNISYEECLRLKRRALTKMREGALKMTCQEFLKYCQGNQEFARAVYFDYDKMKVK